MDLGKDSENVSFWFLSLDLRRIGPSLSYEKLHQSTLLRLSCTARFRLPHYDFI